MKQPQVYTLPEQFIRDPSVPLKWKLYTIINGFWIAGKPVFASNRFFAEKLGCTERHIQDCLAELEKEHLITRHGKSQNRRIIPGGRTDSSWRDEPSDVVRDEPTVHHISDSIADNLMITAKADFLVVSEEEKPRAPKDSHTKQYNALIDWLRELTGAPVKNVGKQYKWLKLAREYDYNPTQLKKKAAELWDNSFYKTSGMDWQTVVQAIDKSPV